MTDTLERQAVIDLLNQLGSERDEDVLAAARELHAQISTTGMSWENLLVPEGGAAEPEPEPEDDETEDDETEDDETEDVETEDDETEDDDEKSTPLPPVGDDKDTLDLIEKLLARAGISDEFREELEDYKSDIADGTFEANDHRYVRALYARLSKN